MALNAQRGAGMSLPLSYPIYNRDKSGGGGDSQAGAGAISLPAGASMYCPRGQYMIQLGRYTVLQIKDPILGVWRTVSKGEGEPAFVSSDGFNYRLINISGCAVGAIVTNAGSGYTSAPTVTASAGDSEWLAVVGGSINTTVTITDGGSGYTVAPTLKISAPPSGGVQATAICTIASGAIDAVTVLNQGAGYTTAPTIEVIPDPRDTTGTGAVLTVNSTLDNSEAVVAVLCTNPGTALTSVPTLSFSGGGGSSAAATAIMAFAATGITVTDGGTGYGNAQPFAVITTGGIVAGTAADTNPLLDKGLFTPRQANMSGTSTAGGLITATGLVINDPGLFQAVPHAIVLAGGSGLATDTGEATVTVGGVSDTFLLFPI